MKKSPKTPLEIIWKFGNNLEICSPFFKKNNYENISIYRNGLIFYEKK